MSYGITKRARPWRGGVALVLACAGLLVAAVPSQAILVDFCPAGGGTITLAPWTGCTSGGASWLYAVTYSNSRTHFHCAVGKAGPQQDGSSSNVTTAVCAYGSSGSGAVTVGAPAGGVLGYARGTHEEAVAAAYYRGQKDV
jgi:hypothetical protein